MGTLPRPDLPPGPHHDLVAELHDLHHSAGWPSLRALARETGVSHTTVSKAFSAPALPTWGTLELIVEALGGSTAEFHALWLAASTPSHESPAPLIAGRRAELNAVRRHLEAGNGLLLVTGEAGIGKTTLVSAAAASAAPFLATGHCLPLSTEVPLLPIADALRAIHGHDGRWFDEVLAADPPFVAGSLARILPELGVTASSGRDDEWSRPRLFAAVDSFLVSLAAARPLGLWIEDLHWADRTTRDLIEHLVARGTPIPVLGTWRLDQGDLSVDVRTWWNRLRRAIGVQVLELSALSRDDTSHQLQLLSGSSPSAAYLDAIHARSAGHPLFTEQLATQRESDPRLPRLLADLLDQRLDELAPPAWCVACALGIAARGVPERLVAEVTDLADDDVATALHDLRAHLMLAAGDDLQLRHPLLAEAVRRRLTATESATLHRRLATSLAKLPDANPAEVAAHWRGAGDELEERRWRVRAALDARARSAWHLEAEQWQRAVDVWPAGLSDPELTLTGAHVMLIETLVLASEASRAAEAARRALAFLSAGTTDVDPRERADLLTVAGPILAMVDSPAEGLARVEEARTIYEESGPPRSLALCLKDEADLLRGLGRFDEAKEAVIRMVHVMRDEPDEEMRLRLFLADLAWHQAVDGDVDQALTTLADASGPVPPEWEPHREIRLSLVRAEIRLLAGCPAAEVAAAASTGLREVRTWDISTHNAGLLVTTLSHALLREGRVTEALRALEPLSGMDQRPDLWAVHSAAGQAQMRLGDLEGAAASFAAASSVPRLNYRRDGELATAAAELELWLGRPGPAFDRLRLVLRDAAGVSAAPVVGGAFVMAARAAADDGSVSKQEVEGLRSACVVDPFGVRGTLPDTRGWKMSWAAELARLSGTDTVADWVAAATEWDKLTRPHDAAYCRWRAARCALREGEGTVAARLLKRATTDAREHALLLEAIAATRAST